MGFTPLSRDFAVAAQDDLSELLRVCGAERAEGEALVTRPLLAAGCRLCLSHSVVAGLGNSADSAAPLTLFSGLGCSAQSL